jgi:hypothetical protein
MICRNNALSINKDTLSLSLPQGREQVIVHYFCKLWTNQAFFENNLIHLSKSDICQSPVILFGKFKG